MDIIAAYSGDSETDDDDIDQENNKRKHDKQNCDDKDLKKIKTNVVPKGRLPPPKGIQSMFVAEPEHEDNPGDHDGRIRTFEHERGNWASFVHAPVSEQQKEFLQDFTEIIIKSLLPITTFHPCGDFHLSLSRVFVIRHHWIQPLVQSIRTKLNLCKGTSPVYTGLKFYCNDEKTRTFVALSLSGKGNELESYIEAIDSVLQDYKLPTYYEEPSFHISLAWALGDVTDRLTDTTTSQLQTKTEEYTEMLGALDINELKFKTGNKMFSLPLHGS